MSTQLSSIEEAIEDIKQGKMVIIVDDENRENEGDLALAADFVTPDAINFMAVEGRGLICTPLEEKICDRLGLPQMMPPLLNGSGFGTPFTISVEAKEGISTGISAYDRSHTIQTLIDPEKGAADIVMPGHVFPLRARAGGVLERRGQTEASVDLARLAGLTPAAVICELMSPDGTMSRLPEILEFGAKHGIKTISVEALARYREAIADTEFATRRGTNIVKEAVAPLPTEYGLFETVVYRDLQNNKDHLVLKMGEVSGDPFLVRLHSECLTGDVLGSLKCDCGQQLQLALEKIAQAGRGMVLYLRQEGRGIGLANKIRAYALQAEGADTVDANTHQGLPADAREYNIAAEILKAEGVENIHLMTNNPAKVAGLEKYGVTVSARVPHEILAGPENDAYLHTKAERMGHILSFNGSAHDVKRRNKLKINSDYSAE